MAFVHAQIKDTVFEEVIGVQFTVTLAAGAETDKQSAQTEQIVGTGPLMMKYITQRRGETS